MLKLIRLAKAMKVPRSRIFVMAVEALLERKRNQALLKALNQAYAEDWTEEEERHFQAPGNVLLKAGEANLPRDSVVNVTQIFTLNKANLMEYLGTLPPRRVRQILEGVRLVLEPRDVE